MFSSTKKRSANTKNNTYEKLAKQLLNVKNAVVRMSLHLSRSAVASYMRISWNTVGSIITRCREYVDPNPEWRFGGLRRVGIDETSYKKWHKYITVVVNHDTGCVIWAHEGHGKEVLKRFLEGLSAGQRALIECYSADGARWISETMGECCPGAERCLDLFHLVEWANEALDEVCMQAWREARSCETGRSPGRQRRGEEKDRIAQKIKGSSVALGKAPENLTDSQRTRVGFIADATKFYRAYCLKESLRTLIIIYQGGYEKAFLFEIDSFLSKINYTLDCSDLSDGI